MGKQYSKISLSGDLGSGKSTICEIFREKYGFSIFHTGKIYRELAEKHQMTAAEFGKYCENHSEIDALIDEALREEGRRNGSIIFDSRMAWFFVPDSFKVHLVVEPDIAADRVLKANRGKIEKFSTTEEAKQQLNVRRQSECVRYYDKYKVDINDFSNYNLVIDTTHRTPQEVADIVVAELEKWKNN